MYNFVHEILGYDLVVSRSTLIRDLALYYPEADFDQIKSAFDIYSRLRREINETFSNLPRVQQPTNIKLLNMQPGLYTNIYKYDIVKAYTILFSRIADQVLSSDLYRKYKLLSDKLSRYVGLLENASKFLSNFLITNVLIHSPFTLNRFRFLISKFIDEIVDKNDVIAREIDGFYTQNKIPIKTHQMYITHTYYNWIAKNKYIRLFKNGSSIKFDSYYKLTPNVVLFALTDIVNKRNIFDVVNTYFKYHSQSVFDYAIKSTDGTTLTFIIDKGVVTLPAPEVTNDLINYINMDYYLNTFYDKYFDLIDILTHIKE